MSSAKPALSLTSAIARRLTLTRQRLAGERPSATPAGIVEVVRDLGCVQIDPINVVARTQYLVLFSRLGKYDPAHLDALLFQERRLFEYWAHCASIVLTEDYPLFGALMKGFPFRARTLEWVKQNAALKRFILTRIRRRGPLLSRQLEENGLRPKAWVSTGWTSGRNISWMLDHLWLSGKLMVAGREGIQKKWDLAERVLPEWTPRQRLPERERVRRAAQRALRALGVATPRHINYHFTRGFYPGLAQALGDLEHEGRLRRVEIKDGRSAWPGEWYAHSDDLPLLEQIHAQTWEARTTLLSPFDNLICDRARTRQLFDFDFTMEIYVPPAKRKYGYYVLPILHGDQLIGRLDPQMDRERGELRVNAVYAEPGAPASAGRAVARAVEDLAAFLGAGEILYNSKRVPKLWKRTLLA